MDGRTLVIADNNDGFRAAVGKALSGAYRVIHCTNGQQALEAALAEKPEILVLDLMLTELDGISLLYRLREADIRPMVLAVTRFFSDYIQSTAQELGIAYIMRKPCEPESVSLRIQDLATRLKPSPSKPFNPTAYIIEQTTALMFSPHHQGSKYFQEAVLIMAVEPGISLTKELYPRLGHRFGGTALQVEHAIRTAILAAHKVSGGRGWDELFPSDPATGTRRISNGVVIARLAEDLRMKQAAVKPHSAPDVQTKN